MPPKGSKRGPDGQWILPNSDLATPQKKARAAGATPQKKANTVTTAKGSRALSAADAQLVQVPDIRKALNQYVKDLAQMVDDDWHDSYEETDQMLCEYLQDCAKHVESVIQVGAEGGAGFDRCHDILKIMADTWSNIQAIPFRGCPEESLRESCRGGDPIELSLDDSDDPETLDVSSINELLVYVWPLLLARAAADDAVTDAALMQMMKDAFDHGVKQPEKPHERESISKETSDAVHRGRVRVQQLALRKEEWLALTSTKKVHRMRRCIDRRFDGSPSRRTRDFHLYDDEADGPDGCTLM